MGEPAVVSIDLGGTNVRLALVSPQGEILSRWEWATATMPDQAALVTALAADLARAERLGDPGRRARGAGAGFAPGRPGGLFPQRGGLE